MIRRSLIAVGLTIVALSAAAQEPNATVELEKTLAEIERRLDAWEDRLEPQETQPPESGTAGAVDLEIDRLHARSSTVADELKSTQTSIAGAKEVMRGILAGFEADWSNLTGYGTRETDLKPPADIPEPPGGVIGGPKPDLAPRIPEVVQPKPGDTSSPNNPGIAREDALRPRVLTRPAATLHKAPGADDGTAVPVFSVMYVFGRADRNGEAWLQVGRSLGKQPEGWIPARDAEEWNSMLVMRYAPASERNRVLFFRRAETIVDIISDFDAAGLAKAYYAQVAGGSFDPRELIAIEPPRSVDQADQPYLMPILDWREEEFDTGYETVLLQLAGLNLDSPNVSPAGGGSGAHSSSASSGPPSERTAGLRIGIAFVIDTTRSMGPYIEVSKRFVRGVYEALDGEGLSDRFRFALLGYRDNVSVDERIGYVTKVFRDFTDEDQKKLFHDGVAEISTSPVSTRNWREDAFAGLEDAIRNLSWGEVDARMIFLITDASSRDLGDPLARNPMLGASAIEAMAVQNDIALFVLHMQTEEASRTSWNAEGYNDHLRAREQDSRLQVTGNQIDAKYFRVGGKTEAAFEQALKRISEDILGTLRKFQSGDEIRPARVAAIGAANAEIVDLLTQSPTGMEVDERNSGLISSAMVNEVFRAQQQYLGAREGTKAPAFYRAWAADRDLIDPRLRPFEVSVFLTRAQISDIADRLDEIVRRLDNKDTGLGEFFSSVQERSGRTVVDPQMRDFLPSYLVGLPYRSKFLSLTRDGWEALGAGQEELLREVRGKIAIYKEVAASQAGWLDLGDRLPEQQVYPLPLRNLP